MPLEIVTFSPDALGTLPANVTVHGRMPVQAFLERMAGASLVVVPLRDPASPHGQTTVVQALALGKAVVATRSPGVVDYVEDGREGFLVDAGDVSGYRRAVMRLYGDSGLTRACSENAVARSERSHVRRVRVGPDGAVQPGGRGHVDRRTRASRGHTPRCPGSGARASTSQRTASA